MKPLNLRHYILVSLKSVFPQILLLTIKIALFFFLCSIGLSVKFGLSSSFYFYDNYTSFVIKQDVSEARRQEILDDIRQVDEEMIEFRGSAVPDGLCKMIIFNTFCWTFQIDQEQIKFVLDQANGELIEGKMPEKPGEMLISQELSKSLNKKVGDVIGRDERIPKSYVVSGIYKSKQNLFLGYSDTEEDFNGYIFKVRKENAKPIYEKLKTYEDELFIYSDYEFLDQLIKSVFNLLKVAGFIILIISALEVTISVSNLNRVYFSERGPEFALLQAVGFKKRFVLNRLFKELGIIIFVGYLGGVIVGQLAMVLFYYLYCFEKGIPYRIFEPSLYLISFILCLFIFVLSYIPIRKFIHKMDYIDVIQEK